MNALTEQDLTPKAAPLLKSFHYKSPRKEMIPEVPKKLYFSIGEISDMLAVSQSLIRYWCKIFKVFPKRSRKGNRQFIEEDVLKLREIYFLVRVEKFKLEGARIKLGIE